MSTYQCLWIEKSDDKTSTHIHQRDLADLPQTNGILVRVAYSSLNYKDALSCAGNRAVTRQYPHQPGIDAAGTIEASDNGQLPIGTDVLITGYDLGMNTPGGLSEYIRVPSEWVLPVPEGLSLKNSMMFGTAGLTAALCINKLEHSGITPQQGPILVTGATGGVGSIATAILSERGYEVIAVTGKPDQQDYLKQIGASKVLLRAEVNEGSPRPLLKPAYAGAIDVAGGATLANLLKQIKPGGSVACCGLVDSPELNTTVMPFIIRGVNLLGVDSVEISLSDKASAWKMVADFCQSENGMAHMQLINQSIALQEAPDYLMKILRGEIQRHILVDMSL
ncbi:putative acrylyl-CoA reductase AcuI [BD1-7 clade bacterium]|uniref:Putative acrylyl-CoA reductase AcuI n=1 Tax=BD1-7 clade bacterium TaxID=2029982 RepID=A0A5S9NSY3_9GAMM|nr:putative acrylyl-CoA reductase AcuI [BD1-7 clade bacterium]CAA0093726.1 putative acrylyl-CoA reductase AcuI [BD1-7 clade bacterium]